MSRLPLEQIKATWRFSSVILILLVHNDWDQTHPSGLPRPEIRATFFAGPFGKRAKRSLVETPAWVVMRRSVGDLPLAVPSWRQKSITFQWAGVSSAIPSSLAISTAISLVHSAGTVMKPSPSTWTVLPAISRVAICYSPFLRFTLDVSCRPFASERVG